MNLVTKVFQISKAEVKCSGKRKRSVRAFQQGSLSCSKWARHKVSPRVFLKFSLGNCEHVTKCPRAFFSNFLFSQMKILFRGLEKIKTFVFVEKN